MKFLKPKWSLNDMLWSLEMKMIKYIEDNYGNIEK